MNQRYKKAVALAASARVANAPSVASNVLLGVFLAFSVPGWAAPDHFGLTAAGLVVCGLLLYVSGNFFNDWKDRHWDAEHRPERALPRGWFTPAFYGAIATITCLAGLGIAAMIHPLCFGVALGIALCILFYTWLHKITPWAVVFMGACRALLPAMGFYGIHGAARVAERHDWALALGCCGLFFHIVGLSLHARRKVLGRSSHQGPTWFLFAAAAGAMFVAAFQYLTLPLGLCLVAVVPYVLWTGIQLLSTGSSVACRVSGLLAAIPLLDGILLVPLAFMAQGNPAAPAILIFGTAPFAFILAIGLQKITPAT